MSFLLSSFLFASAIADVEPLPAPPVTSQPAVERQLEELIAMRKEMRATMEQMQRQLAAFDERIASFEESAAAPQAMGGRASGEERPASLPSKSTPASAPAARASDLPSANLRQAPLLAAPPFHAEQALHERMPGPTDPLVPGYGIRLAEGPLAALYFGLNVYTRYLNQEDLEPTWGDEFGRTFPFDKRQDLELNRVQINFRGWLFDPDFFYNFYAWTQNTDQGNPAQVVVGGNFRTRFSDAFALRYGIFSLPTTRSTSQTFPHWVKVDHRWMADEYFRGSYTTAIQAEGRLSRELEYKAALGNNLSTLGVSASELDNDLNTIATALWWMPTTGEFGPGAGFGDYEEHQRLATLFGVHYSHSREDAQGQPEVDDFENAQIRLSDGTLLFSPDPFRTGGSISRATYDMLDLHAGVKYQGWSLEGEYYLRWLSDFRTIGEIPVSSVFDHGFQLQASTMLVPQTWQAYVGTSTVFGDYGNPWEFGIGVNWFPYKRKEMRVGFQALHEDQAASGSPPLPYQVGAQGWIFTIDAGVWF